jgi:anaphase-promoting complex subunit 3
VLLLLQDLSRVAKRLWQHQCHDVAAACGDLLPALRGCIPVIRWRGEALSEAACHMESVALFQQLRLMAPWSLDGLQLLSTALWHTGATDALTCLAQELEAAHRDHPTTWIVAGNALSAVGEHAGALSMFKRALQLQPAGAYAACLAGHEAVALERAEEASTCFRMALAADQRSFVAWFGLGGVHFRAQEWEAASVHFARAVSIFPMSSTLQCYCGMAQGKLGRVADSLASLKRSIALDGRNAQAWFQLALLQEATGEEGGAYSSLVRTEALAPKEANVQMLKGKVCQALGLVAEAVAAFNRALELAPKDSNAIYRALDGVFAGGAVEAEML